MLMIAPSEAELVRLLARVAVGDRDAFRMFYDLHAAKMYAFAFRITRQGSLAADAVQEAFLQVWQKARQFDPERGHPGAWLLSMVRYRAVDIVRSQPRAMLEADWPEPVDYVADQLQQLVGHQEVKALHACLEKLSTERRALLLLAFFDGLTYVEISNRLVIPLGTIKSNVRRSLGTLRLCLDNQM